MMVGSGKFIERRYPQLVCESKFLGVQQRNRFDLRMRIACENRREQWLQFVNATAKHLKKFFRIGGRALRAEFVIRPKGRNRLRAGAIEPPRFVFLKAPK